MAASNEQLTERLNLTAKLSEQPYDIYLYLHRARCHERLDYPDLAASDAYRALLLTDEFEGGEYENEVRKALDAISRDPDQIDDEPSADEKAVPLCGCELVREMASRAYVLLVRTLAMCGDTDSASSFLERGLEAFPDCQALQDQRGRVLTARASHPSSTSNVSVAKSALVRPYFIRREVYPWNDHEPDRFSEETLSSINSVLETCARKCEVLAVDLPLLFSIDVHGSDSELIDRSQGTTVKQLGMFAKQDIAPGEIVLVEPSILTANNRLLEPLCDACSAILPAPSSTIDIPSCSSCSDIYFCSMKCHDRAQEYYHPAVCGIEDHDVVARDPARSEATDALYLLLVARAFAMAETQNAHPLDLTHITYLWGDFSSSTRMEHTLPFNFKTNIEQPLHILTKMGLNIFEPSTLARYDTWVLNTLFAKFRGVAVAKMNPRTLQPDVAAVHFLWSLANHSCAPNVRWEWGAEEGTFKGQEKGAMGFAARRGDEVIQWGNVKQEGGILKGDEIWNHYCDVGMDVQERREWAAGALGGICMCRRCLFEAKDNMTVGTASTTGNSDGR